MRKNIINFSEVCPLVAIEENGDRSINFITDDELYKVNMYNSLEIRFKDNREIDYLIKKLNLLKEIRG